MNSHPEGEVPSLILIVDLICDYGGVAQLGERLLCKQNVASSILVTSTSLKKHLMIDLQPLSRHPGGAWIARPATDRSSDMSHQRKCSPVLV